MNPYSSNGRSAPSTKLVITPMITTREVCNTSNKIFFFALGKLLLLNYLDVGYFQHPRWMCRSPKEGVAYAPTPPFFSVVSAQPYLRTNPNAKIKNINYFIINIEFYIYNLIFKKQLKISLKFKQNLFFKDFNIFFNFIFLKLTHFLIVNSLFH